VTEVPFRGVDPVRLVAALKAAGFAELGGRTGLYVRLDWPGGALLVPLDPSKADYDDLLAAAVATLEHAADLGVRARQVLDAPEGDR
jgi:hypothetical protein